MYGASTESAWCSGVRTPPPYGARTVTGQWKRLRLRYRMRASWPTSWWYACMVKPPNWISATGTSPATESPTDAPTIADSEIGVSNTRAVAEPSSSAVGGAEHAAVAADVLAEQDDALVARHLVEQRVADGREHGHARHETPPSSRPSVVGRRRRSGADGARATRDVGALRASSRGLSSRGDVVERVVGSTSRASAASMMRSSRASTASTRASWSASSHVPGSREHGAEQLDRIARPPLGELVGGHVARRVVGVGVRAHPVGDSSSSVGPSPAAARARAPRAASTHREHVVAVDADAGDPGGLGLGRERGRRGLAAGRAWRSPSRC